VLGFSSTLTITLFVSSGHDNYQKIIFKQLDQNSKFHYHEVIIND